MKELQAEIKCIVDVMEKKQQEYDTHLGQIKAANNTRFERLEAMNNSNAARFNHIDEALETLLQRHQPFQSPFHGENSGKQVQRQPFQVRNVKLDFPKFDGKDVLDWIFKAEQFFDYYETPDVDRLTIAAVHLDKDAIPWFQMMQRSQPFQSWQAFTRALELDFGPSVFDRPRANLFKLHQSGSVNEYYLEFTALANRVYGLSSDALLDCFISGLQSDLKHEVMVQSPNSILKAVAIAKLFEEKQ